MVYGYIRVSTDKQTIENQRFEINNYCKKNNIILDSWIEDDNVSGAKDYKCRKLGPLIKKAKKGDLILCSEISRLGRDLLMIMEILNILMRNEVRLYTIKDNFKLGDNIQSKIIAFAFGLAAEIERKLISQRTKEALARKRAEGVRLGRAKGSKNSKYKVDGIRDEVINLFKQGVTKTALAKRFKVGKKHDKARHEGRPTSEG